MVPAPPRASNRGLPALFLLAQLLGVAAFLGPAAGLLAEAAGLGAGRPAGTWSPAVQVALLSAALAALALEGLASLGDARRVALLAVLAAQLAALRFVEVAIPGPGEFSPVFAPILLAGHVLGPRFGFQLGALGLLVSALITGGVGPWLPYQMMAAGWVGLGGGLVGRLWRDREPRGRRAELGVLALEGAFWGLAYGFLLDLWAWAFLGGGRPVDEAAAAAWGRLATLLLGSLPWDAFRAAGNVLLVLLLGRPVLTLLRRAGRGWGLSEEGGDEGDEGGAGVSAVRSPEPGAAPEATERDARGPEAAPPEGDPGALATHPLSPVVADRGASPETGGLPLLPPAPVVPLHPHAWLAWALGLAATASMADSPWILVGAGLVAAVVGQAQAGQGAATAAGRPGLPIGRVARLVIPFATVYNGLFSHIGDTVLLRLPEAWPLLGGPVTAEALAYGARTGLQLCVLLAAFVGLQRALGQRELLGLMPRAFGPLALAAGIALAWAPQAGRRLRELSEAQAARGIRPAPGRRAALVRVAALLIPLSAEGLERALNLADLLTARGLVGPGQGLDRAGRRLTALGLGALVAALLLPFLGGAGSAAEAALMACGALLLTGALWRQGRRRPVTRLAPTPWRARDAGVVAGAWFLPLLLLLSQGAVGAASWSPYPSLRWPPADGGLMLALLGLVLPAWVLRRTGVWEHRSEVGVPQGPLSADRAPRGVGLYAQGFGLRYEAASEAALDGLSFDLRPGSLTLLSGPSGCGKSSLLRALCGLVPRTTGGWSWGELRVDGVDPRTAGPAAMGRRLGLVPGDPELGFVADRVAEEVAFALEQAGLPRARIAERVAGSLAAVGLLDQAWRPLDSLSGGQRQRLAVAAALALAPEALVLDEPTSQLDDAAAAGVLRLLRALADAGRTVLLSEHRLDRVLGFVDGRIDLGSGGGGTGGVGPEAAADHRGPQPPPPISAPGEALLTLIDVGFNHGSRPVLADVRLTLRAGELVALTGPSAVGKTTLLRLAAGLLTPSSGAVRREVGLSGPRALTWLPQDPAQLLLAETAREELAITLRAHRLAPVGRHDPEAWLARLGLSHLAERHPRDLSTGERQRLALAALLVMDPRLLLLDEPSRGLDDGNLARLVSILQGLVAEGRTVLLATHDGRLLPSVHRTLRLEGDPEAGRPSRLRPLQ